MKKEYKKIIICIAAVAAVILICFVSFDKFRTFNPVKAGISFARIQLTDLEYTEVKKSPRVILTKSENGNEIFTEIIENEGYEYITGNGSSHIIEKDGKQELVTSHLNKYFTRYTWN